MEEKERFEANKLHNAPFLRAFEVLKQEKGINQQQAAKLINTKSGSLSDYKSGKKKAGQEMYERLARAFGGRLNMRYLTGESEYMLLANVPEEELIEYGQRDGNPDFDVQKKAKAANLTQSEPSTCFPDISSVFNAALAAKDDAIESLKRELRTKDEVIQALHDQVTTKDILITELRHQISQLQMELSQEQSKTTLKNFPFPPGFAESDSKTY